MNKNILKITIKNKNITYSDIFHELNTQRLLTQLNISLGVLKAKPNDDIFKY